MLRGVNEPIRLTNPTCLERRYSLLSLQSSQIWPTTRPHAEGAESVGVVYVTCGTAGEAYVLCLREEWVTRFEQPGAVVLHFCPRGQYINLSWRLAFHVKIGTSWGQK